MEAEKVGRSGHMRGVAAHGAIILEVKSLCDGLQTHPWFVLARSCVLDGWLDLAVWHARTCVHGFSIRASAWGGAEHRLHQAPWYTSRTTSEHKMQIRNKSVHREDQLRDPQAKPGHP